MSKPTELDLLKVLAQRNDEIKKLKKLVLQQEQKLNRIRKVMRD